MIEKPIDILNQFPIRKGKKRKHAFREAVCEYGASLGYFCEIEKGSLGARNIVIGNPETAEHLITAHYDTCAVMIVPNFMTPCNFAIYLLYQIIITLSVLLPAMVFGILIGLLTSNPRIGSHVAGCTAWIFLILMMFGPANKNNANDNTSGVVTVLEIAKNLPDTYRDKVCFILFDLEEAGLIGSTSYSSKHKKEIENQMVWNLDCVGDGDNIVFFPSKKVKKDQNKMDILNRCNTVQDAKSISVRASGFSFYPSDQANFPYGVGIAALKKGKVGLYMARIHTKKDTILDEVNVNILRAAIISAITCDEVQ